MAAPSAKVKLPPPELLRQLILSHFKEPVVFHGLLHWPLLLWTWSDWAQKMGNECLKFRKGKKAATSEPQWERQCEVVHLTLQQFLTAAAEEGSHSWLYFDYKHMADFLANYSDIVEAVSWAKLGFPEKTGLDSTLWIGSTGAHTPCHADTYGCNLVAQVIGRKQWILLPSDTPSVLPTRVPYEESSIYSKRNFYSPNPEMAYELDGARVLTLGPGDVLFVPRRWWHYVENLTPAISINVWLPLERLDDEARLEEGLVRLFVSQLCKDLPTSAHQVILNPNEDDLVDVPLSVTFAQLKMCISKCSDDEGKPECKKAKLELGACDIALSEYSDSMKVVQPVSQDVLKTVFEEKNLTLQTHLATETSVSICSDVRQLPMKLVNAFCQPNVIAQVRQNLQNDT